MKMNTTRLLVIGVCMGIIIGAINIEPWYVYIIIMLAILLPFYYVFDSRYEVIRR